MKTTISILAATAALAMPAAAQDIAVVKLATSQTVRSPVLD